MYPTTEVVHLTTRGSASHDIEVVHRVRTRIPREVTIGGNHKEGSSHDERVADAIQKEEKRLSDETRMVDPEFEAIFATVGHQK